MLDVEGLAAMIDEYTSLISHMSNLAERDELEVEFLKSLEELFAPPLMQPAAANEPVVAS